MSGAVPLLHAITDDRTLATTDLLERAAAIAVGPEVAIHLRGRMGGDRLLRLADALRRITADAGARLYVNDRADVARLAGADGLHLPAAGLPTGTARALLPAGTVVGRSAHSGPEADAAAADGADYVMLGPIWETPSHPTRRPLGLDALRDRTEGRVIAVGGVTAARVADCRAAGAAGIAAIRAVWDAADPAAATRSFLLSLML